MKKYIFVPLLLALVNCCCRAQAGKGPPKTVFSMEGQLAVATNGKAIFVNFGGPSIKYNFSKVAFCLGMMPSLRLEQDAPRPYVTPILGAGLNVLFLNSKRLVLSIPCYYISSKNEWTVAAGIGYVFTKPKKT